MGLIGSYPHYLPIVHRRWAALAWFAIVSWISGCSVVSSGLGGDDSLDPTLDGGIDATTADSSAKIDVGTDAGIDAGNDTTIVAEAGDAAETGDARDAADVADVIDATDAADVRDVADTPDTPDTAPPPLCPDDPDIVACYRFENDGFARQPHDESSYGNDGTTFTGTSFVPGVHGSAVALNAGSSVKVADSASLDVKKITVEMRFRPGALPTATGARAGLLDDNNEYGMFILTGGKIRCSFATATGGSLDSATPFAVVGKWTHVACTYDGVAVIMFIDGVAVNYGAATGDIDGSSTDGMAIGMNDPSGDNFVGDLDDLRIWRRPLTAAEVCASYKSTTTATCP